MKGITKLRSEEVELVVADFFNPRINLVIPNVSWGFLRYEADLVVLTKAGYLYEVEIKVSMNDLKRDHLKKHNHDDPHFKQLYFAITEDMYARGAVDHIPEKAGVLVCGKWRQKQFKNAWHCPKELRIDQVREPVTN